MGLAINFTYKGKRVKKLSVPLKQDLDLKGTFNLLRRLFDLQQSIRELVGDAFEIELDNAEGK